MYRQSKKIFKQQYLLHMSSQYGEHGPLTAEIGWRVWSTKANFIGFRVLASLLHRRPQRRSTKLCTMFGRLLGWYTIYTCWGFLSLTEFCHVQNSLCMQFLRSPILAALLHDTRSVGVSYTAAWYLHSTGQPSRSTLGGRTV